MEKYQLVPGEVTSREIMLWIGAFEAVPPNAVCVIRSSAGDHPLAAWSLWQGESGYPKLLYQRVRIAGLNPQTSTLLQLLVDGNVEATAMATTLPDVLPVLGQRPFILMLGSCFCGDEDKVGSIGNLFLRMPLSLRPDVKILCGDQVYLDSPWKHFLLPHSRAQMESIFFENYRLTWGQRADSGGFSNVLENGGNWFSSDDHEYWNNAPRPAPQYIDTVLPANRRNWWEIAHSLYAAFQTVNPVTQFFVKPVSFMIVDTRIDRDGNQNQLMTAANLKIVSEWVKHLNGPGVLVLGQPLFSQKSGFWGKYKDLGLADFVQYKDLSAIISSAKNSILLLTGDVHFGRIAVAGLPSGAQLIEIISSPMSLVDPLAKGKWEPAPELFPSFPVPGTVSSTVTTQQNFKLNGHHFLTLEFCQQGGKVVLDVKVWPTGETPEQIGKFYLQ